MWTRGSTELPLTGLIGPAAFQSLDFLPSFPFFPHFYLLDASRPGLRNLILFYFISIPRLFYEYKSYRGFQVGFLPFPMLTVDLSSQRAVQRPW